MSKAVKRLKEIVIKKLGIAIEQLGFCYLSIIF